MGQKYSFSDETVKLNNLKLSNEIYNYTITKDFMFQAPWLVTNVNWFVGNQNTCFAGLNVRQAITLVLHCAKTHVAI